MLGIDAGFFVGEMYMSTARSGLIGACSALASMLAVWLVYIGLEHFSGTVNLCAIVLCGLLIGMVQGCFIHRARHRSIAIATLIGMLILWLPVVVATYGFALLALPLLVAYAALVFCSARLGGTLRAHACRPA